MERPIPPPKKSRSWLPLILVGSVLIATAICTIFWQEITGPSASRIWKELDAVLPGENEVTATTEMGLYKMVNHKQSGFVRMKNGDVWRYAFRSHHSVPGDDGFAIFSGKLGTYRCRGTAFCCEVMFEEDEPAADSESFVTLLKECHKTVEKAD
jgi:hypothetical protein